MEQLVVPPTQPIQFTAPRLTASASVLDLGCGAGRDTFYLAGRGHYVTAVDASKEVLEKLIERARTTGLGEKIKPIEARIEDYPVAPFSYELVNCAHVLHFLLREKALGVLQKMKDGVKKDGYVAISTFSKNEDDYRINESLHNRGYFTREELLNLFADFEILLIDERVVNDPGHLGKPEPHEHHVLELVAQKVN